MLLRRTRHGSKEKVIRLLLAAGARDRYVVKHLNSMSLENALECYWVKAREGRADGLRHGWSDAKLREMEELFRGAHYRVRGCNVT